MEFYSNKCNKKIFFRYNRVVQTTIVTKNNINDKLMQHHI